MKKKLVKKTKIKWINLLRILLLLGSISLSIYFYLQIPIQNIIIKNTNYLNDDYIIELANIKTYPKFYEVNKNIIKKELEQSPYIENADIKSKFFHILEIDIQENRALFYRKNNQKIVFEDESSTDENLLFSFRVPQAELPDELLSDFVKAMKNIQEDTLSRISDIVYDPNDIDKERFQLYMDDGNMVYLTLTKFKKINYYNEVLEQLEDKKGIIYLDNGNYFQIKE